jgi:hypothetical protein
MLVTFSRGVTGSTLATIHRRDGVVLELPGYDRKYRVPHDLAHIATERTLGLARGVFGLIASGVMFSNMRVTGGRLRHDASQRSERLLRAYRRDLGVAEMMAGAVHQAVEHGVALRSGRSWASVSAEPFPWSEAQLTEAVDRLADWAAIYRGVGTVDVEWPDELSTSVPVKRTGVKRSRTGRV